jgi:hypothetical protein
MRYRRVGRAAHCHMAIRDASTEAEFNELVLKANGNPQPCVAHVGAPGPYLQSTA